MTWHFFLFIKFLIKLKKKIDLKEKRMPPTRDADEKAIADLVEKYINENDVTWSFPNLSVYIVKKIVCFLLISL